MEAVGIDMGGTKVAAGRVLKDGSLVDRTEVPCPSTAEDLERALIELARSRRTDATRAVGVGAAGLVRHGTGEFVYGPNVPIRNVPIARRIADALGLPTSVDNDANVAALAEQRIGAARGAANALVVTLGTGIGGGVIAQNQIYRGAGFAGEVGHMIVDVNGPLCSCGHHGCWEACASGRVITEAAKEIVRRSPASALARRAGSGPVTGQLLTELAFEGDEACVGVLRDVGRWVGIGLANLICLFDPEVIVIGGGVCSAGDLVLEPIREVLRNAYGARHREGPALVTATLGNDAGIIGAGLMAMEDAVRAA